jgi:hypothetical protein
MKSGRVFFRFTGKSSNMKCSAKMISIVEYSFLNLIFPINQDSRRLPESKMILNNFTSTCIQISHEHLCIYADEFYQYQYNEQLPRTLLYSWKKCWICAIRQSLTPQVIKKVQIVGLFRNLTKLHVYFESLPIVGLLFKVNQSVGL